MPVRNPYICLAIVVSLAAIALVGTAGMVWIAVLGRDPPAALVAVVSLAVGAIAGALAMSPHSASQRSPPNG